MYGFSVQLGYGDRKGQWNISVTGNWRITFEIKKDEILDLNMEDTTNGPYSNDAFASGRICPQTDTGTH